MKKSNTIIELLKFFGILIIGWIMWLLIFAITITPDDAPMTVEPFQGASLWLGLLTAFIISFCIKYNAIHKARQKTKSALSNISIFSERADKLLDKANRVAQKYMDFEQTVHAGISQERRSASTRKQIHSSHQFGLALENYPDLKANQSILELLRQIEVCENDLATQKLTYNNAVESYNSMIYSFPFSVFRRVFGFAEAEFYDSADDDIISDERLGID